MYISFYFSFSVASPISSRHERDRLASADGHWFLRDEIENRLFYQEIDGELEFSISFCLVTLYEWKNVSSSVHETKMDHTFVCQTDGSTFLFKFIQVIFSLEKYCS